MLAFEQLKGLVIKMQENMAAAEKGNKAATVRIRKYAREIKLLADSIRKETLKMK